MEVVIVDGPDAAGRLVGGAIADLVGRRPDAVLGLATGSSPLGRLPRPRPPLRRRRGVTGPRQGVPARRVRRPAPDHPQRYRAFIARELERHVDLAPDAVRGPDVGVDGPALLDACSAYEQAIRAAGGIDLQLLGVGGDGHIGFNEPGSSLASRTRLKTLTDTTRADNARFFASIDEVPRHVLTQGVGTILEARHLVLLAFGAGKAAAVAQAVEGPVTAMVPASALQLHPHATVVVDGAAAAGLALGGYYRETWAHKPGWQGL